MDNNKINKSYMKKYFIVWIVFVIIMSGLIAINLKSKIFSIFTVGIVIGYSLWYVSILIDEENRFINYIKKYYPSIWENKLRRPSQNPFKWWNFINSNDNYDDPVLQKVKQNLKNMMYFHILHIFTIPIIMIVSNIFKRIILILQ